ncbi:Ca2+-binding protein, EF-hand superfamily [Lentzea fradiae]|uniref:Ca2+-binding protein, EF-hand superfamily n=1 Tax=Lentzea fradiae TaxID=200378 RepID=A0A1G7UIB9_9PSEU|nr:EF-hand domain-containing protein [Lentzea fradiae]SDG47296.1 Ca2+-binding protein, EF-hand superfamily [Lentzea fradiae]
MASDFQRQKVSPVFEAMDANHDGYLAEDDFRALTTRWVEVRGGDEEKLAQVMMGWWEALRTAAGRDRVSLDDVMGVVDVLPSSPEAVFGTADAMFTAADADNDDYVSQDEYRMMIRAWLGHDGPVDFARLDLDGDGRLSRHEFAQLWMEFWAGDDETAPGSYAFGPVSGVHEGEELLT